MQKGPGNLIFAKILLVIYLEKLRYQKSDPLGFSQESVMNTDIVSVLQILTFSLIFKFCQILNEKIKFLFFERPFNRFYPWTIKQIFVITITKSFPATLYFSKTYAKSVNNYP